MDEKAAQRDRFDWRLLVYAGMGALIVFVPIMIFANDIGEFFYIVIVAPIVSFFIVIAAIQTRGLWRRFAVLAMLPVYWAVSLGVFLSSPELHTISRWLLWAKDYKAQVLAQPDPGTRIMKHLEWDAWGFPGAGYTTVYLVLDPNDSLSAAAKNDSYGKFSGIPCGVSRVRKLESHYYSLILYTDTDWSHCN
jgi:hypothetical protein